MAHDDYFTPTDLDALRLQAELLAMENSFLKGRVRLLTQELDEAREAAKPTASQSPEPSNPSAAD